MSFNLFIITDVLPSLQLLKICALDHLTLNVFSVADK